MAQGGNQANLNMKLVGSIPIIIPSLDLQNQFAAKIESIEAQKALIQQSIAETQTMFDSRMDYYFG
jgi:type I restriction enzyme S subunit